MRVDPARDAVVGRGEVSTELPRLPLKRELRGRVRLLRPSFINVWLTKTKANAQMKIGLEISARPLNLMCGIPPINPWGGGIFTSLPTYE